MPTFSQIATVVSRKLIDPNNTAVALADVKQAINDAQRFWRYRRFWFNEDSTVFNFVAGNPYVCEDGVSPPAEFAGAPSLPSDFLSEFPEAGFVIRYSNVSYPMTKVHPRDYDAANVSAIGIPSIYTWRKGRFEFYYYPNIDYTCNCYYFKDYADLVADGDTNDFTEYADQLLIYEALSRLSGEDRQDLQMDNSYAAKADREYANLERQTFKKTASGKLEVNSILDSTFSNY
jgi:hypothetical protein